MAKKNISKSTKKIVKRTKAKLSKSKTVKRVKHQISKSTKKVVKKVKAEMPKVVKEIKKDVPKAKSRIMNSKAMADVKSKISDKKKEILTDKNGGPSNERKIIDDMQKELKPITDALSSGASRLSKKLDKK